MRYPIKISSVWKPLFTIFGFRSKSSYVELEDDALKLRFGTASETIPLEDIADVSRAAWPFYYGLGPKLGPKQGVAYVGSTDGVVRIDFAKPHAMNVWGPFRRSKAHCVTLSLEDAEGFIDALRSAASGSRKAGPS